MDNLSELSVVYFENIGRMGSEYTAVVCVCYADHTDHLGWPAVFLKLGTSSEESMWEFFYMGLLYIDVLLVMGRSANLSTACTTVGWWVVSVPNRRRCLRQRPVLLGNRWGLHLVFV